MSERILSGLAPEGVFRFFEELCAIPHGSGNTKAISDYCMNFAHQRGLWALQDAHNNVIIRQAGTAGYEDHPTVILQGHLDMVCAKDPDCPLDMEKDGLRLGVADGYVFAHGTTLGGDDGIAVAYALAILDDSTIPHPPLEAVFTVDEEIGLLGASALDCSPLQGRTLLNIDSESEGILTVGCAGGARCDLVLPFEGGHGCGILGKLTLSGFTGEVMAGETTQNEILTLNDRQAAYVLQRLDVYNKDQIHPGTRLTFTVEGREENFRAEVYATESKVDIETRTFAVRALFPNRQGKQLLPGRFADVKIRMHDIPDAIAIPTEAIVPEMGVDKVYLYKNGKARAVTVRTGLRTESSIQILAGLNLGDTIITSGTLQLRTDLPVKLDNVE